MKTLIGIGTIIPFLGQSGPGLPPPITFEMLITSSVTPVFQTVQGGALDITDMGGGIYSVISYDSITYFEIESNSYITEINWIQGDHINDMANTFSYLNGLTKFECTSSITQNVENFANTWDGCEALLAFPLVDTSNGVYFFSTWSSCYALAAFPVLNMAKAKHVDNAWGGCESLTSFPLLDFSSLSTMNGAWYYNIGLTHFPKIDFKTVTEADTAWVECYGLVCFEELDFSSLIAGNQTFVGITALLQPPATGTTVRDNENAAPGTWTNPNACPAVVYRMIDLDNFNMLDLDNHQMTSRT